MSDDPFILGQSVTQMAPDPSKNPHCAAIDGTLVEFWYDPPEEQFGPWMAEHGAWAKDMRGYLRATVHPDSLDVLNALFTAGELGSQRTMAWCSRLNNHYNLVQFGAPFDPKGLDSGDSGSPAEKGTGGSSAPAGAKKTAKSTKSSKTSTVTS